MGQLQAAEAARVSRDTVRRAEAATHCPRRAGLSRLLDIYGATDEKRAEIFALAATVAATDPFGLLRDELPPRYSLYLDAEAEADEIRYWEPLIVPGLLQTAEYAAAQARSALPDANEREITVRVETKMRRQEAFYERGAKLFAVVSEAALRVQVGGPLILASQLHRLFDDSHKPEIAIQVIPFAAGAHPAMTTSFTMLSFPDMLRDVVYLESAFGDLIIEDPAELAASAIRYQRLCATALPRESSAALIATAHRDIRQETRCE